MRQNIIAGKPAKAHALALMKTILAANDNTDRRAVHDSGRLLAEEEEEEEEEEEQPQPQPFVDHDYKETTSALLVVVPSDV